ncbi:MAG TPA: PspA/IM30 family protein, partial [Coleofasciculaceae cyanobacterium]
NWCKTGVSYSQQIRDFIPVIDHINVEGLYEPIQQALQDKKQNEAQQLLEQALAKIKVVWDTIQPQYNEAVREMEAWNQVALQALKQNREDLARAAIQRKLNYQKRATELQGQLEQLAKMTETLIRNSRNL